jgi:peptidoglycan/LPS O-acetylase OafA/YrhL
MSLLDFWVEGNAGGAWYISFIIFLYLAYPLIYMFLFKKGARGGGASHDIVRSAHRGCVFNLSLGAFLFSHCRNWFRTSSYFLYRVLFRKSGARKKSLSCVVVGCFGWGGAVAFFLGMTVGNVHSHWWWRFYYIIGGVSLSYLLALLFSLLSKAGAWANRFFAFVGSFSLELYVSHTAMTGFFHLHRFPLLAI